MKLEDARVLITGGATGIGLATARALKAGGARVAVCGRRQEPLDTAAAEYHVTPIQGDVSVEADAQRIVATTVRELGGFNVLINNAAIGSFQTLLDTQVEDFERVLRVNVTGAMLMGRESARHFVAHGGGTIINVGSTAARKGFARGSAYAASKFALSALTECWRAELRKQDVRVMQLDPSEVQTNFGGSDRESRPMNESKLVADDCAHLIVSLVTLPDRGFVTDLTLWATNPR